MSHDDLIVYIKRQVDKSMPEDIIRTKLLSVGWKEDDINQAFSEIKIDVPIINTPDVVINNTDQVKSSPYQAKDPYLEPVANVKENTYKSETHETDLFPKLEPKTQYFDPTNKNEVTIENNQSNLGNQDTQTFKPVMPDDFVPTQDLNNPNIKPNIEEFSPATQTQTFRVPKESESTQTFQAPKVVETTVPIKEPVSNFKGVSIDPLINSYPNDYNSPLQNQNILQKKKSKVGIVIFVLILISVIVFGIYFGLQKGVIIINLDALNKNNNQEKIIDTNPINTKEEDLKKEDLMGDNINLETLNQEEMTREIENQKPVETKEDIVKEDTIKEPSKLVPIEPKTDLEIELYSLFPAFSIAMKSKNEPNLKGSCLNPEQKSIFKYKDNYVDVYSGIRNILIKTKGEGACFSDETKFALSIPDIKDKTKFYCLDDKNLYKVDKLITGPECK